jgi:hypothetical protein
MKTLLRLAALLALLFVPLVAGAQSSISFPANGGLSRAAADVTYLRLDATNDPLTGALTSSNGNFSSTGALIPLVLTSGLTATGGVDTYMKFIVTDNAASNDFAFRFYDAAGVTQLFAVSGDGAGFFTSYVQAANVFSAGFYSLDSVARFVPTASGPNTYTSNDAADGSMVAHKFTTTNTAATTDKLLSIQNGTTEKVYFDPVGSLIPVADATTSIGSSTLRFIGYFSAVRVPVIADANGGTRVTLTASGATTVASALAATGGVDVGNIISVGAADYSATDKVLSLQDNAGTELTYFTGTGDIVPGTTVVSDIGTSAVRWRTTFVQTGNYSNAIVTPSIFDTGSAQTRAAFTVTGKSAYTANTTLTGGEDLGHTFFVTTDLGAADKVLQWGDAGTVELGAVFGDGSMQLDGDLTIDGGNILNAGTAAGLNLAIASGANAAGEYGVTVGTNSTSTAETIFSAATDVDGTPAHKFTVLGTGNVGLGGDASDLYAVSIVGQTIVQALPRGFNMGLDLILESNTAAGGSVIGMLYDATIDPGNTEHMIGLDVEGQIIADVGETHPTAVQLNVRGPAKSGTGTITDGYAISVSSAASAYATNIYGVHITSANAASTLNYGLYVTAPASATTNIAIATDGLVQFQREVAAVPAAPFACAAAYAGTQLYVDDTNDGAEGFMCRCGKGADDTTYAWAKVGITPAAACF